MHSDQTHGSHRTLIRLYRPRAVIGWAGCFRVFIDSTDCGELWPRQARELSICPGQHVIQLRQGIFVRSRPLTINVEDGKAMDIACSKFATAVGLVGLHQANRVESEAIRRFLPSLPLPRSLAVPPGD